MAYTSMVYNNNDTTGRLPQGITNISFTSDIATQQQDTSSSSEINPDGMQVIRESIQSQDISRRTADIIMSSWRTSTKKQYSTYVRKWILYCKQRKINNIHADLSDGLDFLTELFDVHNLGYSAMNTARSALSSFIILNYTTGSGTSVSFGTHPLVIRFMKAIYNLRPPCTKYQDTWDVDIVLNYLRKLPPVKELNLKQLTLKLTMLLAILSASRCQTLHYLSIKNMKQRASKFVFHFDDLLKQSRPGYVVKPLEFVSYPVNRKLCIVTVLKEYLKRTKRIRSSSYLLVSYIKPSAQVSTATISRWIRMVMFAAGIDINKFKVHSVRSATTTKANARNIPLKDIMTLAGWTSESTFKKYYLKPVRRPVQPMSSALLQ